MEDFRARDADRDSAVEVIEAAYANGRIGDADRELRLSRARSAETVDELEGLTRDLPRVPDVVRPGPAAPAPLPRASRSGLWVAGVVVAGIGALGVVPLLFLSSATDLSVSTEVESAPDEASVAVESAVPFELTPAQVRRFVRDYERKFSRADAFQTVFYPARVSVEVPARGSRSRATTWSYDGTWRQSAATTAVAGSPKTVDLGAIDLRRLFANIATAKKVLRVQRGELTHVVVRRTAGEAPVVNIYVSNEFDESGYLSTTPSGEEIRRYPYAA